MLFFKIENRIRSTEWGDLQENDSLSDELSLKCPRGMHSAIPRRQVWAWDREGLVCYCRIQDPGCATELGTPLWPFPTSQNSAWACETWLITCRHSLMRTYGAKCWRPVVRFQPPAAAGACAGCSLLRMRAERAVRSLWRLNPLWSVSLSLRGTVRRERDSPVFFLAACRSSMRWCCWFCWAPWRTPTSVAFRVRNWEVT